MTINQFNQLSKEDAKEKLSMCCGSKRWVEEMEARRPFSSIENIRLDAEILWFSLAEEDFLEAFKAHPKIGDMKSLKEKYQNTIDIASNEQSGVQNAKDQVLIELKQRNEEYEKKFGFIFIICATGKSAVEMLQHLNKRLTNSRSQEVSNASIEQSKITKIRLEKMLCPH